MLLANWQGFTSLTLITVGLAVLVAMVTRSTTAEQTQDQTIERMRVQMVAFSQYTLLLHGTPLWAWQGNRAPVTALVNGTYQNCLVVVTGGVPKVLALSTGVEADLRHAPARRRVTVFA